MVAIGVQVLLERAIATTVTSFAHWRHGSPAEQHMLELKKGGCFDSRHGNTVTITVEIRSGQLSMLASPQDHPA